MRTVLEVGVLSTVIGVTAVACASRYPTPAQHLADATGSVGAANAAGATDQPEAQLHLKLAQDEIDQARALMRDGDNKRADYVLLRAKADADLAFALSRERSAKTAAQQAAADVAAMQTGTPGMKTPSERSPQTTPTPPMHTPGATP